MVFIRDVSSVAASWRARGLTNSQVIATGDNTVMMPARALDET
jgi:hypothetical protein